MSPTTEGRTLNPQLQALLALQADDDAIQAVRSRLAELAPRAARLDSERQAAEKALAGAQQAVAREEQRFAQLDGRAQDFRRMNERAVAQIDQVRRPQHAMAASAQLDISRRALSDAEAELNASVQRLETLRQTVAVAEQGLAALEERQSEARQALDAERGTLDEELRAAEARRRETARGVEARTLAKYDRVRGRRQDTSVFALHGVACGNCDTAIPTQRRAALASSGQIDVCESCGVLLYAAE